MSDVSTCTHTAGLAKLSTFEEDEDEDEDDNTDINAGRDANGNNSANFSRTRKLSDVLLPCKPLGPKRIAGYAANKCFAFISEK